MPRNLFRRVETVFPVVTSGMKEHGMKFSIGLARQRESQGHAVQPDGVYKLRDGNEPPFDAQAEFVAEAQRRRKKRMAAVAAAVAS
jgi:polyphosphate kinase